MKAIEARKIAESKALNGIENIYRAIKQAADKGDFSCFIYTNLSIGIKNELILGGFKVKALPSMRNEDPSYSIEW